MINRNVRNGFFITIKWNIGGQRVDDCYKVGKYAAIPTLAKPLFEYILIHENNIRIALELASKATEANQFRD
jgi:hypothetical protein